MLLTILTPYTIVGLYNLDRKAAFVFTMAIIVSGVTYTFTDAGYTLFRILMLYCIKYELDLTVFLNADFPTLRNHWSVRGYGGPQLRYVLFQRGIIPKLIQILCKNVSLSLREK